MHAALKRVQLCGLPFANFGRRFWTLKNARRWPKIIMRSAYTYSTQYRDQSGIFRKCFGQPSEPYDNIHQIKISSRIPRFITGPIYFNGSSNDLIHLALNNLFYNSNFIILIFNVTLWTQWLRRHPVWKWSVSSIVRVCPELCTLCSKVSVERNYLQVHEILLHGAVRYRWLM